MSKCGDCFYYGGDIRHTEADCFRYPPVVASEGEHLDIITVTVRPSVGENEKACGEFKPDKNKKSWDSADEDGTTKI